MDITLGPETGEPDRNKLALCLSGGGYRATLFHTGGLIRLNELGILSKLNAVSSVSGGSVLNGILAVKWGRLDWTREPGIASNFPEEVVKTVLDVTSIDFRTPPLVTDRILRFWEWIKLICTDYSAANLLQKQYEDHLYGTATLADQKDGPEFVFCATNMQTGVNWRMSRLRVGDYQVGYQPPDGLRVSEAVAASSAFPLAFPPLVLKFDPAKFAGGKLVPGDNEMRERVVLTDGGVYDNLGLEPVWKSHFNVIVSDGGKPMFMKEEQRGFVVNRLARCQEVESNQVVALRKRMLIALFKSDHHAGAYYGLRSWHKKYELEGSVGYEPAVIDKIENVRTDFNKFSDGEKACLINHGYTLADAAARKWLGKLICEKPRPFQIPHPEFTDADKALDVL